MEMVRLTTCADAFEARVLAARLGAEGFVWSLRGGHDGPFAIGPVEVLVDADDYTAARDLLVTDGDGQHDVGPADAEPEHPTTGRDLLVVLAVLAAAVLFTIARIGAKV